MRKGNGMHQFNWFSFFYEIVDLMEELHFLFEVRLGQCTDGVGHLPKKNCGDVELIPVGDGLSCDGFGMMRRHWRRYIRRNNYIMLTTFLHKVKMLFICVSIM